MVPFYQGKFRVSRADIGPKALTPPGTETASAGPDLPPGVVAPPDLQASPGPNLVALPASAEPASPVAFLAEIGLKGDRNIWLKTPEMDLELAGDVVFHANEKGMGLTGEVSTLRGTYSVLNSRFDIDRATVEFTDPNDPAASYIDAQASTTVLDEDITVYVTGSVILPNIRLETQSGMSEAEIYELLALRVKRNDATTAAQEGTISDAFRRSYLAAITNRFGGELGRELGLDTFDYQQGDPGVRSSVTVGKNVGRDFFFKYRQAVGTADPALEASVTREALDSPERAFTVEYRLNRIFMLQGETGTVPPGDDYLNVDLKAEWGY
jgi:autotransporter translocation and assembly factor TamB